jgi:hypothetical protein
MDAGTVRGLNFLTRKYWSCEFGAEADARVAGRGSRSRLSYVVLPIALLLTCVSRPYYTDGTMSQVVPLS